MLKLQLLLELMVSGLITMMGREHYLFKLQPGHEHEVARDSNSRC